MEVGTACDSQLEPLCGILLTKDGMKDNSLEPEPWNGSSHGQGCEFKSSVFQIESSRKPLR